MRRGDPPAPPRSDPDHSHLQCRLRPRTCPFLKFSAKVVSERQRRKNAKKWHDDYGYDHETRNAAVLSLSGVGFRQREIAEAMGIGQPRVCRILQELTRNGKPELWEPYM